MSALNTEIYALASRDANLLIKEQDDVDAWWQLVELLVSYSKPAVLRQRIETAKRRAHQQSASKENGNG